MITDKDVERINILAHKAKSPEGLTEAEKEEQTRLRRKYLDSFRQSMQAQLDAIVIQDPDGTRHPLKKEE